MDFLSYFFVCLIITTTYVIPTSSVVYTGFIYLTKMFTFLLTDKEKGRVVGDSRLSKGTCWTPC